MIVGDLVFCQGYRGLILKTEYSMYSTEHYVYWFDLHANGDNSPFCWIPEKQLLKIA